jgi:hypothetical protein
MSAIATPKDLCYLRTKLLCLTQSALGLRWDYSGRTIYEMEKGKRAIPPSLQLLIQHETLVAKAKGLITSLSKTSDPEKRALLLERTIALMTDANVGTGVLETGRH